MHTRAFLVVLGVLSLNAFALAQKPGIGALTLPDGVITHTEGDTLIASRNDSTELSVQVFPVTLDPSDRKSYLRACAVQEGLPPFVREVSLDQRKLAHIDWGGFVLGTIPAPVRVEKAEGAAGVHFLNNHAVVDSSGVHGAVRSNSDSGGDGDYQQPTGQPAYQKIVVLYLVNKQAFVMRLSIRLPEGDPMQLTDIQRQWRFGK